MFIYITYIHTCTHTYIHTYIHTYMHTYSDEALSLSTKPASDVGRVPSLGSTTAAGSFPKRSPAWPLLFLGFRVWVLGFGVWGLGFRV